MFQTSLHTCSSIGMNVSISRICAASSISRLSYLKASSMNSRRFKAACVQVMATIWGKRWEGPNNEVRTRYHGIHGTKRGLGGLWRGELVIAPDKEVFNPPNRIPLHYASLRSVPFSRLPLPLPGLTFACLLMR